MAYSLSEKSIKKLDGVHPDLVAVVEDAIKISDIDFRVDEGLRTPELQQHYLKIGKSKTLNSRHLYGLAVDLSGIKDGISVYKFQHGDQVKIQKVLNRAMKISALDLGVPLKFGGDWGWDYFHWELDKKVYPDKWEGNKI